MREVEVVGVRVEMPSRSPIVLLRERQAGRYLPVWIGQAEAGAISLAQQGVVPQRPLTHDLLLGVVEALGRRLDAVHVVAVRDNVFFSELVLDGGLTVESRTSDAIALALRAGCPVLVDEAVLETASMPPPEDEAEDDEVEKFREFLDQVSAEDFEPPEGSDDDAPGAETP